MSCCPLLLVASNFESLPSMPRSEVPGVWTRSRDCQTCTSYWFSTAHAQRFARRSVVEFPGFPTRWHVAAGGVVCVNRIFVSTAAVLGESSSCCDAASPVERYKCLDADVVVGPAATRPAAYSSIFLGPVPFRAKCQECNSAVVPGQRRDVFVIRTRVTTFGGAPGRIAWTGGEQ